VVDIGQARVEGEPGEQPVDTFTAAGNRAVDALLGEQQSALDAVGDQRVEQRLAQRLVVRQGHELIECRHDDGVVVHCRCPSVVALAKGGPGTRM